MPRQVIGLIVLLVAISAAVVSLVAARPAVADRPLAWSLRNAYVLRSQSTYREGNVRDCPRPPITFMSEPPKVPPGCPGTPELFDAQFPLRYERPGVRLGVAVSGATVVALTGVGLMLFGRTKA